MIGSVRVLESRFVQSCTNIANAPQISNAEIAILGRSNVGKSSLINALLNNKNLAKSSSTPGKTKLVNFFVSKWQLNSYQKNSSLGAPFALGENFGEQQTPSLVLSPKFSPNTKLPPQILELDSNESNDSSLRGKAKAIQKNNNVDCHDSAFAESCNDKNIKNANSTNPPQKQSKGLRCCFGLFSRETSEIGLGRPSSEVLCENNSNEYPRPNCTQAEFVIHILDFPGFGYAKVSKTERDSWDKNLSTFLKKRESIKLFIHLIDSRHTNLALDDEIRAFLRSIVRADADILEVFTKADKLKKSEIHALKGRILVSTTKKDLGQKDSKDNIESLRHAILRTMYHI